MEKNDFLIFPKIYAFHPLVMPRQSTTVPQDFPHNIIGESIADDISDRWTLTARE